MHCVALTVELTLCPDVAVPPAERFRAQLSKLQEMGFGDEAANITALQATGGSLNAAVERLLSQL